MNTKLEQLRTAIRRNMTMITAGFVYIVYGLFLAREIYLGRGNEYAASGRFGWWTYRAVFLLWLAPLAILLVIILIGHVMKSRDHP
jgi:hypothetical protein